MIFVVHSDDIAPTFSVRVFTDLFLRFTFIRCGSFEHTRLGVKIACAYHFLLFSVRALIDSLLATVVLQKLQSCYL
jgi:hypothetical protein